MTPLPEHLRLQEESSVLRVSCEIVGSGAEKRKLKSTDVTLMSDVMKTLIVLNLRAVTRKAIIDRLKGRTGRYGYVHAHDADTQQYVAVTVLPDPVIHLRIMTNNHELNQLILLNDLCEKSELIFEEAGLPQSVRDSVHELLEGKDRFDQHVVFQQGGERDHISVRIGYVNSIGFADPSASQKQKKWRGPGS